MLIISQRQDKIVFTDSGMSLQIVNNKQEFNDMEQELFFDGNVSGDIDYFPYAVICENANRFPILMGVYTDYNTAEETLKNIIQTIENKNKDTVLFFDSTNNTLGAIAYNKTKE